MTRKKIKKHKFSYVLQTIIALFMSSFVYIHRRQRRRWKNEQLVTLSIYANRPWKVPDHDISIILVNYATLYIVQAFDRISKHKVSFLVKKKTAYLITV